MTDLQTSLEGSHTERVAILSVRSGIAPQDVLELMEEHPALFRVWESRLFSHG